MYAMKKYLSLLLILALLLPCSARADEAADAELIWRTADFADVLHQMAISKYYRESCGATGAEVVRSATAVTPGAEWAKGKPEDHGFDSAVLAKVPDYIRDREEPDETEQALDEAFGFD